MRTRLAALSLLAAVSLAACADSPAGPLASTQSANATGSSSAGTTSTARVRIYAALLPPAGAPFANAKGKAQWDSRYGNTKREFELEVEHLPAGMSVEFFAGGVSLGVRTTDAYGEAEIEFSTEHGQSVPSTVSGLAIEVRDAQGAVIVAGSFPTT